MSPPSSRANPAVLEFYRALPFNTRDSVEASVAALRADDHLAAYPVLAPLVRPGARILDVGCGTGWLANSLAHHHGAMVTGIDFNPVAIERARAVAARMGLATRFEVADLFAWEPPAPFDLVISLGVLHHTDDCAAALEHVCRAFVRTGGHAFVGLYHRHGRKPLLDHFRAMAAGGASEAQMLARYRELHSRLADETQLESWFRDQVLHPHETQHTLEEVMPILARAGMRLESTSINGFGPVEPRAALVTAEKRLGDVAARRLAANEYYTGFFVVLARKDALGALDSKPYVEHHPVFGYRYVPGARMDLPRPGGGTYRIAINSQGVRSDREYAFAKPPGVTRFIVCGDSMAAGQFVGNDLRFSEQLERLVPGLEVVNLALEGSGTDQQLLLYEHAGLAYEHDAVILLPFLQNIRRNLVDAREGVAAGSGARVLRGKPRFELVHGRLELRNVPVPELACEHAAGVATDTDRSAVARWKARINGMRGIDRAKRLLYAIHPHEPFPEYRERNGAAWQLMAAIVRRMKALAGARPLVIAPTFYSSYVRFRMAHNYLDRYAELAADPGVHVVDLLPCFRRDGAGDGAFQEPHDMHFSAYGHLVLADALAGELARIGLVAARAGR